MKNENEKENNNNKKKKNKKALIGREKIEVKATLKTFNIVSYHFFLQ